MSHTWMIYGANGYTGRLIAREAKRRGMSPLLAGRGSSVEDLARELGLEARRFALDDVAVVANNLAGVFAVLNCAGPFSATSRTMVDACLRAKTHYFDITGEIDVFEAIHSRDAELKAAGVAAIPGVGFDVVPTDCVAALLKERLPDATSLTLAFKADGGPSAGTAKSTIEGVSKGGRVRREGRITAVPLAAKTKEVVYKDRPVFSVLIPWGDVSTAYYSTHIPNIEVYMAAPRSMVTASRILGVATKLAPVEKFLKTLAAKTVKGPDENLLKNGKSRVWGEVRNAAGKTVELRLETPMGYTLTVDAALAAMEHALKDGIKPGALTPSIAFGSRFVYELPGVTELAAVR